MILALEVLGVVLLLQANLLAYVGLRLLLAPRHYQFPWLAPVVGGRQAEEPEPQSIAEYLAAREAERQREAS